MTYEQLLIEASQHGVDIFEENIRGSIKGLYCNNTIWINKCITTTIEKKCILSEELGYYHTSSGNILDQSDIRNRKQEIRARDWACQRLVTLNDFVSAYESGVCNKFELAEFLGITEDFLEMTLDYYRRKYEHYAFFKSYIIFFDPLVLVKMLEY